MFNFDGWPSIIIVVIFVVAAYLSARQMAQQEPNDSANGDTPAAPNES